MASTRYCARCLTTFMDDPEACPNLACGGNRPKQGWGILLGPGDLLDRHYQIKKPLAVGGAGLTYLAKEIGDDNTPQGPDLAIKVLYTQRDAGPFLQRLANEAQILQSLAHEHIVLCRGFVHRTGHAPYLVTQFEHGGSLSGHVEHVGPLSPRVAASILRQILLALDIAHQRGVVHRDLKPENVLLAAPVDQDVVPHIRVADFGIAKVQGGVGGKLTRMGSFVGTPEYAAPEQFEGIAPTPATDVFAAGGLLYYLIVGQPPVNFEHRNDIEHSYDELLQQIPPRLPPNLEDPEGIAILQDVLVHVMAVKPEERWTIQQTLNRIGPLCSPPATRASAPDPTIAPKVAPTRPDGQIPGRSEETFVTEWPADGKSVDRPTIESIHGASTPAPVKRQSTPMGPVEPVEDGPPEAPKTVWERRTPAPAPEAVPPPPPAQAPPPPPVGAAPPPPSTPTLAPAESGSSAVNEMPPAGLTTGAALDVPPPPPRPGGLAQGGTTETLPPPPPTATPTADGPVMPPPPPAAAPPVPAPPSAPRSAPISASMANPPPPTAPPARPDPAPSGGGGKVAVAAVGGLGAIAVIVGVVAVVCVVVLIGGAYATGWIGGGRHHGPKDPIVDPVNPPIAEGFDLTAPADAAGQAERDDILRTLADEAAPKMVATCDAHGTVTVNLVIAGDGTITSTSWEGDSLAPKTKRCMDKVLNGVTVPRSTSQEAKLRASFPL